MCGYIISLVHVKLHVEVWLIHCHANGLTPRGSRSVIGHIFCNTWQFTPLCIIHVHYNYVFRPVSVIIIDHMHMTSQKGAQLRWGSNETLPRASSPSMQPGGQTLQATPPGWPARARALRGWVPMRTASTTRARCATLDWRRCYGDVTLCDVNV